MASKASQSFATLIADTFPKGSSEAKAFTKLMNGPVDINKDPPAASIIADPKNWKALGAKVKEQWNR